MQRLHAENFAVWVSQCSKRLNWLALSNNCNPSCPGTHAHTHRSHTYYTNFGQFSVCLVSFRCFIFLVRDILRHIVNCTNNIGHHRFGLILSKCTYIDENSLQLQWLLSWRYYFSFYWWNLLNGGKKLIFSGLFSAKQHFV